MRLHSVERSAQAQVGRLRVIYIKVKRPQEVHNKGAESVVGESGRRRRLANERSRRLAEMAPMTWFHN